MQLLAEYTKSQLNRDIKINFTDNADCLEIRRNLDALFDGSTLLETSSEIQKARLFGHLQSCKECCRSFDVRTRVRSTRRNRIF